ncbi:hypothetical protein L198_02873 [Cryptococcus wingfieldii CBS 7118]|uniref:Uncharacterized protein n=1 Tax=Cryptococcus wingfieldii CBS 7118 TaxID=1295528 RepID=A0A1E3JI36_9TREE|nr:hypothetical protein L198_02873 [Cryptococcus wingfieldii CBS 7118]ODO00554.1 hypothetical protein L198_02873 [Cryptococcus wingfieldii CBS 7118]
MNGSLFQIPKSHGHLSESDHHTFTLKNLSLLSVSPDDKSAKQRPKEKMTAIAPSPPTIPLPQTPLLTPSSFSSPKSTPTPSLTTGQTRPKVQLPVIPSSPLRQSTLPTLPEIQLQEGPALKAHPTRGIPSTLAIPSNPLPPPMSIGASLTSGSGLGGLAGLGPGFSLTPRHGPPPASLIRLPPAPPPTLEFHPPEGSKPAFGGLGAAFGGGPSAGGGAASGVAGGGGGEWSMPNSLRDLQSLSRSVDRSLIPPVKPTKLAPSPISPVSPGRLDGVREKRGMMDIGESGGFERRLAEIELELKGQRSDPSSGELELKGQRSDPSSGERSLSHSLSARSRPFLESTRDDESTIQGTLLSQNDGNELIGRVRRRNDKMLENGNGQAIDEVDVEWCFLCGEEGKREKGGMELKQAGEGVGWQWVCGECSKRS